MSSHPPAEFKKVTFTRAMLGRIIGEEFTACLREIAHTQHLLRSYERTEAAVNERACILAAGTVYREPTQPEVDSQKTNAWAQITEENKAADWGFARKSLVTDFLYEARHEVALPVRQGFVVPVLRQGILDTTEKLVLVAQPDGVAARNRAAVAAASQSAQPQDFDIGRAA